MASSSKKLKMSSSHSKSNVFSTEQDEMLIELVAQNPVLYDIKLEAYKDRLMKENIWRNISNCLNKTGDECKTRWKHIRDSYNRYKRKKKTGTGNAALPKTSKWEFYERLAFLESSLSTETISNSPLEDTQNDLIHIEGNEENGITEKDKVVDDDDIRSMIKNEFKHEMTCSKVNKSNTEKVTKQNINITEEIQKQNAYKPEKAAFKKKRETKQDEFLQYLKRGDVAMLKQAYDEKVEHSIDDDVDSFGNHVKSVLSNLPPLLKVKAKTEIFNVMSKYELISIETPNSTPSSSMSHYSTYSVPSPITPPLPSHESNYENTCTNISHSIFFPANKHYN